MMGSISDVRILLASTCSPDDRKVLAAARALALRGVDVAVGSDQFWGLAYWSRAVGRRMRYPHPRNDPAAFLRSLRDLATAERCDAVLPMNDYTTVALAMGAASLEGTVQTALPPPDSVQLAQNKHELGRLAGQLGLDTPETWLADGPAGVRTAVGAAGLPCVMKLQRGAGAVGMRILHRHEDVARLTPAAGVTDAVFDFDHFVVQRWVPGTTHDVCLVASHGEIRAALTQTRLRTYPVDGGVGVDCMTTDEPDLVEQAAVLVRALRWHGPAQVEFKRDATSGRTWLIELNGRLWGTLGLSIWAGMDFPWLLVRLALDGDIAPTSDYRRGARYRWTFPLGLLHAAQSGDPWQALRAIVHPSRDVGGDWHWTDPVPQLAESMYALRRMWHRRRLGPERRSAGPAA